MQSWSWALIIILAAGGLGLLAAHAWRLETQRRGQAAWERLARVRFPADRPRMKGRNGRNGSD